MLLAIPAAVGLLLTASRDRAEVALAVGWPVGVWLLYGALSMNYSGTCCTIRWFVPLLAAGYFALAVVARDYPLFRTHFVNLGVGGAGVAVVFWPGGAGGGSPPA